MCLCVRQRSGTLPLQQESKQQQRRTRNPAFARDRMLEWQGDRFKPASHTDSEDSNSSSSTDSSQRSEGAGDDSEHESDLNDFIVDDDVPAATADDGSADQHVHEPSSNAVSAMLEEAGMVSSRTDKQHFAIYIEYLVYDLVDSTFAVRVRGSSRLRKYFDSAVRHVEESLAFKR